MSLQRTAVSAIENPSEITFFPGEVESLLRREHLSRLSLNHTTTWRWSPEDDARVYRRAGLQAIGLSYHKLLRFGLKDSIPAIRRSGLRVSSLGWAGGFAGLPGGYRYNDAIQDGKRLIKLARLLNAESVTILSGPQRGHIRPQALRCLQDGLFDLSLTAERLGIRLALQPMHPLFTEKWSFLNSLQDTFNVVRSLDPKVVGVSLGTYHVCDDPDFEHYTRLLLPYIANVTVSDWKETTDGDNDRAIPGQGITPLVTMVSHLERIGYRGRYEVEVWSRDTWGAEGKTVLKNCLAGMGDLLQAAAPFPYEAKTPARQR
jgi:sugar phosphate isomerase/epimerase